MAANHRDAARERLGAIRPTAHARISALAQELRAARRRGRELVAELESETARAGQARGQVSETHQNQALAQENEALRNHNQPLAGTIREVLESTAWKATRPVRWLTERVPASARQRLRQRRGFNGRRLLERPLDDVLRSGSPDFPFMIYWASEPWTRRWGGRADAALMPQEYPPGWERTFAADIAPLLRHSRYLRLHEKPVVAIYRVMHIPEPARAIERLRQCLADEGFPEVQLIGGWVQLDPNEQVPEVAEGAGLDAYFEFPPHNMPFEAMTTAAKKAARGLSRYLHDDGATVDMAINQLAAGSARFRYRGAMVGWDNTPRRGRNSVVFHGATPANVRRWFRAAVRPARAEVVGSETAVFINAWNEWAEGAYPEPDRDFGRGWLEAIASVVPPRSSDQSAGRDRGRNPVTAD